ncbi:MAG: hypothetical protein PHE53_04250 [Thermoguttaceae bacterium]|nr:hypothetical protein [Thermoguttaceae bacterium]
MPEYRKHATANDRYRDVGKKSFGRTLRFRPSLLECPFNIPPQTDRLRSKWSADGNRTTRPDCLRGWPREY